MCCYWKDRVKANSSHGCWYKALLSEFLSFKNSTAKQVNQCVTTLYVLFFVLHLYPTGVADAYSPHSGHGQNYTIGLGFLLQPYTTLCTFVLLCFVHVAVPLLMDVRISQVMLWAVYYMQRLSRQDAWTQPQILRVRMPSRARFPECPWRETWQRKAIRQASKDTQRLPASPPQHHPFSSPSSLISTPAPVQLHSYIRWRRWRHARRKEGMGTFASHSLEGL